MKSRQGKASVRSTKKPATRKKSGMRSSRSASSRLAIHDT